MEAREVLADKDYSITFFRDACLEVVGGLVEIYLLAAEEIGVVPPHYSDADLKDAQDALSTWDSECNVLQATSSY